MGIRRIIAALLCMMALAASGRAQCACDVFVQKWNFFASREIDDALAARMMGRSYPEDCPVPLSDLRCLNILYYNFDGVVCSGELVCNASVADDLLDIFIALYDAGYRLRSVRLVDEFGADDNLSMAADNTSCFNWRRVPGTGRISAHAYGLAVDINPLENPYVRKGGVLPPEGAAYADRSRDFEHKIDPEDLCFKLFRSKGFTWGGFWRSQKDYQHFELRNAVRGQTK